MTQRRPGHRAGPRRSRDEQRSDGPGLSPGEALPYDLLDEGERLTCEQLREFQLHRLRATLRHAYENVELYRKKFDEAGVRPDDCRSLEDLSGFPFTTKADLRDTYPFGMFAVPMEHVRRIHASSGTTGRPTVVGYTDNDISMWADVMARSIRQPAAAPVTRFTSPSDMACSLGASARTTAPNAPGAQSSRPPAV